MSEMATMEQHRTTDFELQAPASPARLESRLFSTGAFHMFVPTDSDEMHLAHHVHGEQSWQARVLRFFHKQSVQYLLMGLLLVDVLVLFFDLFLLAQFPSCSIIERDAVSCCASHEGEAPQERLRLLAELDGNGAGEEICLAPGTVGSYPAGCDPERYPHVHQAEGAFFIITITILSIFLLENIVQIVVLSPQVYFRHFFYVLDFLIISVSIALEIVFRVHDDEALQSVVGLLVVGRVWRFVRISHGLIEVTSELNAQRYHGLREYADQLEALLKKEGIPVPPNGKFRTPREVSNDREIAQPYHEGEKDTANK
jgi:hypothetical protein